MIISQDAEVKRLCNKKKLKKMWRHLMTLKYPLELLKQLHDAILLQSIKGYPIWTLLSRVIFVWILSSEWHVLHLLSNLNTRNDLVGPLRIWGRNKEIYCDTQRSDFLYIIEIYLNGVLPQHRAITFWTGKECLTLGWCFFFFCVHCWTSERVFLQ